MNSRAAAPPLSRLAPRRTTGEPIAQASVSAKRMTSWGCNGVDALIANDVILYATRSGLGLREIVYSLTEDKMVANDLNMIAPHIAKGETEELSGIIDMDYQQEPSSIVWCVRKDGQLLGLLYARTEKIFGWFRLVTDGEFESVAVLPSTGKEDEVWVSVKRTIDGSTKRFIEYFKPYEFWGQISDYFGVDCGLTFDGGAGVGITSISNASPPIVTAAGHTLVDGYKVQIKEVEGMTEVNCSPTKAFTVSNANIGAGTFVLSGIDATRWGVYTSGGEVKRVTNSLSGLGHLEGEELDIMIDGAVHPRREVVSGVISPLDHYGNKIHAGIPYTSILSPMKIEAKLDSGSTKSMLKRIKEVVMGVYQSVHAKVGRSESVLDEIAFGKGTATELSNEPKVVPFRGDLGYSADLVIVQDKPLPLTVTYLSCTMDVDQ